MGHRIPPELYKNATSSRMRIQRQSEGFKHGEGTSHEKARLRLVDALVNAGWTVYADMEFSVHFHLISCIGNDIRETEYFHAFDIYATKKHSNGLTSELIVEIDGRSHGSKVQQGKDRRAEQYAAFFLPDARLIRMDIGILLRQAISDKSILDLYRI